MQVASSASENHAVPQRPRDGISTDAQLVRTGPQQPVTTVFLLTIPPASRGARNTQSYSETSCTASAVGDMTPWYYTMFVSSRVPGSEAVPLLARQSSTTTTELSTAYKRLRSQNNKSYIFAFCHNPEELWLRHHASRTVLQFGASKKSVARKGGVAAWAASSVAFSCAAHPICWTPISPNSMLHADTQQEQQQSKVSRRCLVSSHRKRVVQLVW